MRQRIPISIRNERSALIALFAISVLTMVAFAATLTLGDQRRMVVLLASPSDSDEVPSTLSEVAITFNREPDRVAVEQAFAISPAVAGVAHWRGRTFVFVPSSPWPVGRVTVSVGSGKLGRASEPLVDPFKLEFTVREPGIAAIVTKGDEQDLVELRDNGEQTVLLAAPRIIDFAVSPDGREVAVVTSDSSYHGGLALVSLSDNRATALVQSPEINIGGVTWSSDSSTLLVIRRDLLPSGDEGVPRAWLLRRGGEFIGPVDPEGDPSLSPSWSPDGQRIAFVSPASARLVVRNLTTQETQVLGQPRGGEPVWSADSTAVAFETVPDTATSNPPQPVRVVSLDGTVDRTFGVAGEIRSAPKFWNATTLASLRMRVGASGGGTELVFESLDDGSVIRTVHLTGGADFIPGWDINPARTKIVFADQVAGKTTSYELDLESGQRTMLPIPAESPRWIP